jgi:hypothetical protein
MTRSPEARQAGFSLLEVVGGLLVFAFGVLALCRAQIASINTNAFSHDMMHATMLAHKQLERLLNIPFDNPANPGDPEWPLNDRNGDGTDKDLHYGLNRTGSAEADHFVTGEGKLAYFSLSWNIAPDMPVPGNKTIRLHVEWTDQKKVLHTVAIEAVKGGSY